MAYEVIKPMKAKTPEGVREIRPGEIVTLPEPEAQRLLEAGRIKPYIPATDRPLPYIAKDGSLIIPSQKTEPEGKAVEQVQAFDKGGYLLSLIEQGRRERWKDDTLFEHIDTARHTGELQGPWGLRIHDSPLVAGGVYWLLSCDTARGQIPVEDIGFTLREVAQLKMVSVVFRGAKIMKVVKETATTHRGKEGLSMSQSSPCPSKAGAAGTRPPF